MTRTLALTAALLVAAPVPAQVVLNWSNVTWPTNSPTSSYSLGGGTVSFSTTYDVTDGQTIINPRINSNHTGGLGAGTLSLDLAHDPVTAAHSDIVLTVTFSHPGGVRDVTLPFFDIDRGANAPPAYIDRVRVTASQGGVSRAVGVTANGPSTAISGTHTVYGTAYSTQGDGPDAANANATFFAAGPLDTLVITLDTYVGSNGTVQADPNLSGVSLYNVTFSPVPEPTTLVLAGMAAATLGWRARWRPLPLAVPAGA